MVLNEESIDMVLNEESIDGFSTCKKSFISIVIGSVVSESVVSESVVSESVVSGSILFVLFVNNHPIVHVESPPFTEIPSITSSLENPKDTKYLIIESDML
jgi:hypothetical protein